MWLNDFNTETRTRLLQFLWRQWAQLGVAAADIPERDGWVIDLEALWLFSSTMARYDARLFDEIMDCLLKNSAFINMPRLKSMQRKFNFGDLAVIAAMADTISRHNSRLNWQFNSAKFKKPENQPLFISEGMTGLDFGPRDETFQNYGLVRGKLELRGLSRQFNRVMPECTLLRLRSIFGVSARAEIILYLLTHDVAHPSQIATETGFSQKNIQDTMVDVSASGLITAGQLEGRKMVYFLKHKSDNLLLPVGIQPPHWITWTPLLKAVEMIYKIIDGLAKLNLSDTMASTELRLLGIETQRLFQQAGFPTALTDHSPYNGTTYINVFRDDINALLQQLKS